MGYLIRKTRVRVVEPCCDNCKVRVEMPHGGREGPSTTADIDSELHAGRVRSVIRERHMWCIILGYHMSPVHHVMIQKESAIVGQGMVWGTLPSDVLPVKLSCSS